VARLAGIVFVCACGGGSASVGASATTTLTVGSSGEPPADVDVHLHETPSYIADSDRLYVEITSDGEHADVLRKSASVGLGKLPNIVSVADGGDVELHVEIASLTPARDGTACKVKMFVLRLPQHDLLAIADGSGRVTGRDAVDACLSAMGTAIVQQKLPPFLARQLQDKS